MVVLGILRPFWFNIGYLSLCYFLPSQSAGTLFAKKHGSCSTTVTCNCNFSVWRILIPCYNPRKSISLESWLSEECSLGLMLIIIQTQTLYITLNLCEFAVFLLKVLSYSTDSVGEIYVSALIRDCIGMLNQFPWTLIDFSLVQMMNLWDS